MVRKYLIVAYTSGYAGLHGMNEVDTVFLDDENCNPKEELTLLGLEMARDVAESYDDIYEDHEREAEQQWDWDHPDEPFGFDNEECAELFDEIVGADLETDFYIFTPEYTHLDDAAPSFDEVDEWLEKGIIERFE